ncbi:hypothetical protein GCM10027160_05370 [Streptomyces calidiresistens]
MAPAIDTGAVVTAEYLAVPGNRTVRTLGDPEPEPSFPDVRYHPHEAERAFALSRVHGVMSVQPTAAAGVPAAVGARRGTRRNDPPDPARCPRRVPRWGCQRC